VTGVAAELVEETGMGRRKHRGKALVAGWWRVAAVVGVLAAVAGWATAGVISRSDADSAPDEAGTPARAVQITAPRADRQVSQVEAVSGTSRDMQPGEVVWILIRRFVPTEAYYPASGPCVSTGDTWRCPDVRIGGTAPIGQFELTPIVLDGRGQRVLIDYLRAAGNASGPGLAQPPQGVVHRGPAVVVSRGR
jgi:hypothetical protein